jgi:hypothetical protein
VISLKACVVVVLLLPICGMFGRVYNWQGVGDICHFYSEVNVCDSDAWTM